MPDSSTAHISRTTTAPEVSSLPIRLRKCKPLHIYLFVSTDKPSYRSKTRRGDNAKRREWVCLKVSIKSRERSRDKMKRWHLIIFIIVLNDQTGKAHRI